MRTARLSYLKVLTLKYWNCFAWTVGWKCNEKLVCKDILSIELSGPHMLSSEWTDKTMSTSLNALNSQTYHTIIKHILIFNSTRLFCRQELMSGAHFQAIFIADKSIKHVGRAEDTLLYMKCTLLFKDRLFSLFIHLMVKPLI